MNSVSVIYIAGSGRSGSTVLDRILGTLEGAVSVNELRLFYRGGISDTRCACGSPFATCPFWAEVTARVFKDAAEAERVRFLYERVNHSRFFPQILTGLATPTFRRELHEFSSWLRRLYMTISELSGARIIVDSSKTPGLALILSQVPDIDFHLVHLVRDVRAVAYAWQKKKQNPATAGFMETHKPLRTVFFWYTLNLLCEVLGTRVPYHRVRYEDMAGQPQEVLQALVDQIRPTTGQRLNFVTRDSICLGPLHSISGNPDRFASGLTKIRLDDAWIERSPATARRMVTAMALPLLLRYGYPLTPKVLDDMRGEPANAR